MKKPIVTLREIKDEVLRGDCNVACAAIRSDLGPLETRTLQKIYRRQVLEAIEQINAQYIR